MKTSLHIKILLVLFSIHFLQACGPDPTYGTGGEFFNPPTIIDNDGDGDQTGNQSIYLYVGDTSNGDLGGRSTADTACVTGLPVALAGYNAHAFISTSATDELQDMPANYGVPTDLPIVSLINSQVAANWGALFSAPLDQTLTAAGVVNAGTYFWTGSNANGTLAAASCNGFTDGASGSGAAGSSDVNTGWMWAQSSFCTGIKRVLCIAYE